MIDPAALRILDFPDPALRRRADPVPAITDEVRAVAARMIDLMVRAEGIGLAAPQVGVPWRLFVAFVPPSPEDGRAPGDEPETCQAEPEVFINPVLRDFGGELVQFEEGCLSLPDIRGDVRRPDQVTLDALDLAGAPVTRRARGLLSRCWQHEADHLDGVLIIDRMTPMARMKNRSRIRDLERLAAGAR
ncbi:MAG: peptide deformylase [Planctomycetota bacterium]|nr:MAG: peptide deformylase [Planctomycetota bacterium]